MKKALLICGLLLGSAPPTPAAGPGDAAVKVFATVRYPDPVRPWANGKVVETFGSGAVIEGKKILTNAHLVLYATEVYVQARPGDDKIEAKVEALAPDIDLAVLSVKEEQFFQKQSALPRSRKLPQVQDTVVVYGFPQGGNDLSVTKGVVSRIGYGPYYQRAFGQIIQVSAAINPGNSGGPAVVDNAMIGIVFGRLGEGENIGYVIPNMEIDLFLEDIKDGRYDGKLLESAGTDFQRLENEALRRFLKLDAKVKGLVIMPPRHRPADYPLKEFDVLTKIGDHHVDNEGMVQLPGDLRQFFFCLIPSLARDNAVPITLLRDGRPLTVRLPVSNHDNRLLRDYQGEKLSYFIHGPLVFAPAKANALGLYMRLNAGLNVNRSPLSVRAFDRTQFPEEELVVVTSPMFSHRIAKGYQDPLGQVLMELNGVKIKNLRHLVEMIRDSTDEFLKLRFAEEGSEVLVFDHVQLNKATEEIMEENGIAPNRRGSEDMLKVWKKKAAARGP